MNSYYYFLSLISNNATDTYEVFVGSMVLYGIGGPSYKVHHARPIAYNPATIQNDIAVLILAQEIHFNSFVNKIPLASTARVGGELATLSGWGAYYVVTTAYAIPYSFALLYATVPVINNETCKVSSTDNSYRGLTPGMLCAGYSEGNVGRKCFCYYYLN